MWLSIPGCHHVPEKGPQALGGKIFRRCIVSFCALLKETHYSEALQTVAARIPPLVTVNHLWLSPTFKCNASPVLLPLTGIQLPSLQPVFLSTLRVCAQGRRKERDTWTPLQCRVQGLSSVLQSTLACFYRILISLPLFCGDFSTTYLCAP